MRKARIKFRDAATRLGGRADKRVAAYLPSNYYIGETYLDQDNNYVIEIWGEDVAGWTLDGYVIPRLASGLIWAEEIK